MRQDNLKFRIGRFSRRHFSTFLLIPSVIPLLLILAWPLLQVTWYSFTDMNLRRYDDYQFIGLQNFRNLFSDPYFYHALINSFKIAVWTLLFTAVIGFVLALLLNCEFRGRQFFRVLVVIPWATPIVAATLIWAWIFDYQFGLMNWLLQSLGVIARNIGWYIDPHYAMGTIIWVNIWKNLPIVTIMLLSGLQAIDAGLYEAATIDGANALHRFWYVTLPGVKPIASIILLLVTLWSFREMSTVKLMTSGGPARATETLVYYLYDQGFVSYRLGSASATGLVTLVICLILSILYMGTIMRKER